MAGKYVGDGTDDRPIAHRCGRRPSLVIVMREVYGATGPDCYFLSIYPGYVVSMYLMGYWEVRDVDENNFYVEGVATNASGRTYDWVALTDGCVTGEGLTWQG